MQQEGKCCSQKDEQGFDGEKNAKSKWFAFGFKRCKRWPRRGAALSSWDKIRDQEPKWDTEFKGCHPESETTDSGLIYISTVHMYRRFVLLFLNAS